jgi:hypothetical protein
VELVDLHADEAQAEQEGHEQPTQNAGLVPLCIASMAKP